MAQGTVTTYEEFRLNIGNDVHNLASDSFKILLTAETPSASETTPDSTDYTEVTGTNYTAGGESVTATYTEQDGTATFATTSAASWSQNGSGPTGINFAVLYNTSAPSSDAIAFIDMRDGGTTAISLVDGDITVSAGTVFTLA